MPISFTVHVPQHHQLSEDDIDTINETFQQKLNEEISYPDFISPATIAKISANYDNTLCKRDACEFLKEIAMEESFPLSEMGVEYILDKWEIREQEVGEGELEGEGRGKFLLPYFEKLVRSPGGLFLDEKGGIREKKALNAQSKLENHLEKMNRVLREEQVIEDLVEEIEEQSCKKYAETGYPARLRMFIQKNYDCETGEVTSPSLVNVFFGSSKVLDPLVEEAAKFKVQELFAWEKKRLLLYFGRWVDSLVLSDEKRKVLSKHLREAIDSVVTAKFSESVIVQDSVESFKAKLSIAILDHCLGAPNFPGKKLPRSKKDQIKHLHKVVVEKKIIEIVLDRIPRLLDIGFVNRLQGWMRKYGFGKVVTRLNSELLGKLDDVFSNNCQKRDEWLIQIDQSLRALKEGCLPAMALKSGILRRVEWHCSLATGVKTPTSTNATIPFQVLESCSDLSPTSFLGKKDIKNLIGSSSFSLSDEDFEKLLGRGTEIEVPIKVKNDPAQAHPNDRTLPFTPLSRALSLSMYGVTDFDEYLYMKMDEQQGLNLWAACESPGYPQTPILLLLEEHEEESNNDRISKEKLMMNAVLLCPDEARQKWSENGGIDQIYQQPPLFPMLRICRRKVSGGEGNEGEQQREINIFGVVSDCLEPKTLSFPSKSFISFEEVFGERFVGASKVKIVEAGGGSESDRLVIAQLMSYVVKSVWKKREEEGAKVRIKLVVPEENFLWECFCDEQKQVFQEEPFRSQVFLSFVDYLLCI